MNNQKKQQPVLYVPGASHEADKMKAMYDQFDAVAALGGDERPDVRDPEDPFGLKEPPVPYKEDYRQGLRVAEKIVRAFQLCVRDHNLGPKTAIFAAELAIINIINAKDIPIKPEEIEEARKKAFDYYQSVINTIPDPTPEAR